MAGSNLYSQLGCNMTATLTPVGGNSQTPIATVGLVSIDGPNVNRSEVETTVLSSTFKPYKPTIAEGEITLNIRHMSADPACQALRAASTSYPCPLYTVAITYEDGGTDSFNAFPKGYTISGVENESIINAAVPFRMTTAPVFTAGTALTF